GIPRCMQRCATGRSFPGGCSSTFWPGARPDSASAVVLGRTNSERSSFSQVVGGTRSGSWAVRFHSSLDRVRESDGWHDPVEHETWPLSCRTLHVVGKRRFSNMPLLAPPLPAPEGPQ